MRLPPHYPIAGRGRRAGQLEHINPQWEAEQVAIESTTGRISALLHEAAETHHRVYRLTDGEDPDWASWYASWLVRLSELPKLVKMQPVRSHLIHFLVQVDRDYALASPSERWEDWYAERLEQWCAQDADLPETV